MTSEAMRTQFNVQSAILSILTFSLAIALTVKSEAQPLPNGKHVDSQGDRFYQIDQWLPTPNDQRTASGAPGPEYWQQRADYKISIALDDINQRLSGVAQIDYHNESPHILNLSLIHI